MSLELHQNYIGVFWANMFMKETWESISMERIINLHIEKLPEGFYLATSDDIQGLVAQGRTVTETMEIARDVARRLLEAQKERKHILKLRPVAKRFDMPLVFAN